MNKDRLTRLERLLRANAANPTGMKFDMGRWGFAQEGCEAGVDCGTAGCAVGLAILSGEFEAEGLKRCGGSTRYIYPAYQVNAARYIHWDAVMQFFDVDHETAYALFDAAAYDVIQGAEAELAVADRIRDFVNLATPPVG